jgi:hypothetical protein
MQFNKQFDFKQNQVSIFAVFPSRSSLTLAVSKFWFLFKDADGLVHDGRGISYRIGIPMF